MNIRSWLYQRTMRAAIQYSFYGDSYKTRGRRTFDVRPEFTPTIRDRSLNGKQRRIARKAGNR